jgi:hypothetical protein
MIGPSFTNLFMQPSTTQPSVNLVEQQPSVNLPPYITPTTPTPKGGSPFGDMSEKLDSKSQGLALMLYALGGALKGDKDFVQNTLALQQMQEGKKKQEEQEELWEKWKTKNSDLLPESLKDLANVMTPKQGIEFATKIFTQKGVEDTARQREYAQLQNILEDPNKSPEEKDLAKKFFAGITTGKSKEQVTRELITSLSKSTDPDTGMLFTPEKIEQRINQLLPLLSGTYEQPLPQPTQGSFGYKKYKVTPEV